MEGSDIREWQRWIKDTFNRWNINYPVEVDGVYGVGTRSATASMLYCLGIYHVKAMENGVSPKLRSKARHRKLNANERARFIARAGHRRKLRKRFKMGGTGHLAPPLNRILQHSWGWAPGHDGVDLICDPRAIGYAICDGIVRRADNGGWWGKGAPSPAVAAKGDGIVIIQSTVNVGRFGRGRFRKGMCFGYGHAENVEVSVGERVKAGQRICEAGMANAWHFHFMVNGGSYANTQGRGDRDPWPFIARALKQRGR